MTLASGSERSVVIGSHPFNAVLIALDLAFRSFVPFVLVGASLHLPSAVVRVIRSLLIFERRMAGYRLGFPSEIRLCASRSVRRWLSSPPE
jgi:hypothetical protein